MNNLNTTNEESTIGRWGIAWQQFMKENYPEEAAELMSTDRWNELALVIDREAWKMLELLRKQYAKTNPRPSDFMETVKWENTRSFYVEHEVMEQVVLRVKVKT